MKWHSTSLAKALVGAVIAIVVLKVAGTPENSEKIYDFFNAKPVAPKPEQPDPNAVKEALRLEYVRLAASVPPADKARLDLFRTLVSQCIGHMEGTPFDLSQALELPDGYNPADANLRRSLSVRANFPEDMIVYFNQDLENNRVRPTVCWVMINTDLTDSQIEILHAGAVPALDRLLARGWETRLNISKDGGRSATNAFDHSKDPSCSRVAAISYNFSSGETAGKVGFTALENGNGCMLLETIGWK